MAAKPDSGRPFRWAALACTAVILVAVGVGPETVGAAGPPVAPAGLEWRRVWAAEPVISVFLDDRGYSVSMAMEEYLAGVIAAEMDPDWPLEALAAQAVCSRTETLRNMQLGIGPRRIHGTDACTSPQHLQAYAPARINAAVRQAVAMTRGQVLTYDRDLIFSLYSNSAGGLTATGREAFPDLGHPSPYLASVPSLGDAVTPPAEETWRLAVPRWQLEGVTGAAPGSSSTVKISRYGVSGRALEITVGSKKISGPALREAVGSDVFRSTLITSIDQGTGAVIFTGRGWGHGTGLDQRGAQALAQAGWKASAILTHYFQGCALERLWK